MPSAIEVTPAKWSNIRVLFDNGVYSVISGLYDGGPRRVLGERWNGGEEDPRGFPNVAGHPVWHIAPEFLETAILHQLLNVLEVSLIAGFHEYETAILAELETRQ